MFMPDLIGVMRLNVPDRSYPSCYKHGNELENDLFGQTAIRHRGDARGWVNNSTLGAAPVVTEAVEN